jgi:hypothetical protein
MKKKFLKAKSFLTWLNQHPASSISAIPLRKQVNIQLHDDEFLFILSWICIVLAHWDNSPRIDMSFPSALDRGF